MENKFKKILNDFCTGIVILILSYIMLYFMGGKQLYISELSTFLKIELFVPQIIFSGVLYVIFMQIIKCTNAFTVPGKENTYSDLFKYLVKFFALLILFCILAKFSEIPENAWNIYVFNAVIIMILNAVVSMIIQLKEVKKINNTLKNRNTESTKKQKEN